MIAYHTVSRTTIATIAAALSLNFSLPARVLAMSGGFPPTLPGGEIVEDISPSDIPTQAAQTLLEYAAIDLGLPISSLHISAAQLVQWRDGCLGFAEPGDICTTEVIDGWRAIVASDEDHQIYHSTDDIDNPLFWSSADTAPQSPQPGFSQFNPILPDLIDAGWFIFDEIPSGRWFDPPTSYSFLFATIGDSQFTEIIDFPVGIDPDEQFLVSVGSEILGEFGFGQSVDFLTLLGEGVSEFTIAGIDSAIDPASPKAFPVRLAFDTPTASFRMRAISASFPEPGSAIALFGLAFLGIRQRMRRKSAQTRDRSHD